MRHLQDADAAGRSAPERGSGSYHARLDHERRHRRLSRLHGAMGGSSMSGLLRDFRDFIGKGSVIELAVGLIVGGALGTIIKSFVEELIIPLTGLITKVDFSNLYFVLK